MRLAVLDAFKEGIAVLCGHGPAGGQVDGPIRGYGNAVHAALRGRSPFVVAGGQRFPVVGRRGRAAQQRFPARVHGVDRAACLCERLPCPVGKVEYRFHIAPHGYPEARETPEGKSAASSARQRNRQGRLFQCFFMIATSTKIVYNRIRGFLTVPF